MPSMATNPTSPNTVRHLSQTSIAVPIDTTTSATDDQTPAELTAVVDELLDSLSTKFQSVSGEMFAKMDDMSRRIDALEEGLRSEGVKSDGKAKK